jgi:mono/diheme cytochrome c family protein
MKKILFLSLICAAVAAACHKKAVPEITARTEFPPAPKSSIKQLAENSPEAITAGKTIFETRCNRCHDLKDTKGYTPDRWTSILQIMIPRARLNNEEAKQVTSYVMANAKK